MTATPSQLAIPLRCGPSGPPFDLAAALAALGVAGSVTRVWSIYNCPGDDLDVDPNVRTAVQRTEIVCGPTDLGRIYFMWWQLLLLPASRSQDPEAQPAAIYAQITADDTGTGTLQQNLQLGVKLASEEFGEGNWYPWIADGAGSVLVRPGTDCPVFVVGSNHLSLWALAADDVVGAEIPNLRSSVLIVELDVPVANTDRVDL